MKKVKPNKNTSFALNLLIGVSVAWILYGIFYIFYDFTQNYKSYGLLASISLNDKRAVTTGYDFYQFLAFSDRAIPAGKDIDWVFPEGGYLGNNEYLFYKAYYYLYPRNYRANSEYIIVYDRQGYDMPSGFKMFAEYAKGKYILHYADKESKDSKE